MLRHGTTTCEAKSGYGLSFDSELRLLGALRAAGAEHPIDLIPTFLGAHTLPPEYRERLWELFGDEIEGLAERFGAPAARWRDAAPRP